jgi:hypothetical protein
MRTQHCFFYLFSFLLYSDYFSNARKAYEFAWKPLKNIGCRQKGGRKVFIGIPDFYIIVVYLLCILSTLACVVYGLYNWNKGGDVEILQIKEEAEWEKG